MLEYRLVGFISDLDGNQNQVFTADPVLRSGDDLFVAEAKQWTPEQLRKVSPSALRFVEQIPDEEQVTVQPGEVVWLAGRTFVTELAAITRTPASSLAQLRREIGRWNRTRRLGFAWSVGTRAQLMRLIAEPTTDITAMLNRALFDRQELSHGDAESYFLVFRGLVQRDTLEHLVTRAVYYQARHDDQRLMSVARRAVRVGVATDNDDFLAGVRARISRLSEPRPADAGQVRPQKGSVRADVLALLGSMMIVETGAAAEHAPQQWAPFKHRDSALRAQTVAAAITALTDRSISMEDAANMGRLRHD
jgi:hypothetical protein